MGGSANTGKNESSSSSVSSQDVWGPQGEALQQLYGSAADLFSNIDNFTSPVSDLSSNLVPYMQGITSDATGAYQDMLSGGSVGDPEGIRQNLLDSIHATTTSPSNTSAMYQSIVGGPGNTYIDPMVEAMRDSSLENLDRMQSGTAMDAAMAGQSGSSRHAMQNAMLASEVNQDMLDREMNMRGGAYDKDLAMKMHIAGLADDNVQAGQDRLMNLLGMYDDNVSTGMGSATGMQNLGMGSLSPIMQAAQMPWDLIGNYSSVIGGPQVLSSGSGSGDSKGFGHGGGFSMKG